MGRQCLIIAGIEGMVHLQVFRGLVSCSREKESMMCRMRSIVMSELMVLLLAVSLWGQKDAAAPPPAKPAEDYSGMYSFLRDGEFVQVTVEDAGRVTGFVSRYGDLDSDRGIFLDHFFKQGKLDGKELAFTTEAVHGVWFEFKGTVERGEGKNPGDEAYYVLKGTLLEYSTDADKKTSTKSREVEFKAFPQDMDSDAPKKD